MNNYKIRVNNEAESREAQELFFELGYGWTNEFEKKVTTSQDAIDEGYSSNYQISFIYAEKDGRLLHDTNDQDAYKSFVDSTAQELTLPQLRDLVVLHRDDVSDATHEDKRGEKIYLTSNKVIYYWQGGWCRSAINKSNDYKEYIANSLKTIQHDQNHSLINGADAKIAWAKGQDLQIDTGSGFEDLTDNHYLAVFDLESNMFRLKPRTVKIEIEVPAPFEPKDGDECFILSSDSEDGFYRFVYEENSGFHKNLIQFGVWRTVADIKIVVDQLRKLKEQSK